GKTIYTVYIAIVSLIILTPVYFIVRFSSRQTATKVCRSAAKLLQVLSFCPMEVVGTNHLSEVSPMIFTANHASYIDVAIMLALLPSHTLFVGKKELFRAPIVRTFMQKLGYLAVDRTDLPKGLEDTKQIEDALKKGNS